MSFSLLLIITDENNKAKLVGDTWGNCFNGLSQSLNNWIRMNMIYKSRLSEMFYKVGALKTSAKFTWKHLRPVANAAKKGLKRRCFPGNSGKLLRTPFLQNPSGRLLLDFFIYFTFSFLLPSKLVSRNHVFSGISTVTNIVNFLIRKLYFAKQTKMLLNIYQNSQENTSTAVWCKNETRTPKPWTSGPWDPSQIL